MKKALLFTLLPLLLCSCTTVKESKEEESTPVIPSEQQPLEEQHTEQTETGGNIETGGQTETGGNTEGGGSQTGGNTGNAVTTNLSLDEWQNWTFNDGRDPCYDDDWDFYYGDSYKPNGRLWENPTYKDLSGIEFDKNCYTVSPKFNTYEKVEMRFYFWFSHHTSSKYNGSDGEPQFKIEEYDNSNKLIGTSEIEIKRSDVPTNGTAKQCKVYITNYPMTSFKLKWNNYIQNGPDGYTAILTQIGLKGWPQT